MEASPVIEKDVLLMFNKKFGNMVGTEFSKPEICDTIESVKKSIYKKNDEYKKDQIFKDILGDIMLVQNEKIDSKKKLIGAFVDKFKMSLNRPPTLQEMIDNLIKVDENLAITEEMLVEYIHDNL
jgi:hypothetical protein